jgi:hypothetical protein
MANFLRYFPRTILRITLAIFVAGVMLFGFQSSSPNLGDRWTMTGVLARDYQFDYVSWELSAIGVKMVQTLYGVHPYMTEEDRSQYVRRYMADLSRAQQLEAQISAIYASEGIGEAEADTAARRNERDALRADLLERQPLVEAILEGQVAAVLIDQGFGFYDQIIPPVSAHFTQVPNLLVVSPRDQIRFDVSLNLVSMPVDAQIALEDRIEDELDVAALTVPLGGIALYPAMILETSSISYALEVIAHEWLHHYLLAFPLGFQYDFGGETRIINETTASLFGREIGPMVLRRYYPDLAPPPPVPVAPSPAETETSTPVVPEPPRFNFGREMNETRLQVDALLAEGRVEEAEQYMEERRQLFVANGYVMRKLNQAFFAFYGGYQSGSPGEGGSDPIGPAVQGIRNATPNVHTWIQQMRGITTRDQLLGLRAALERATQSGR